MEFASSNDVALVEVLDPFGRGLDVQFSCIWQGGASAKSLSRLSRRDVEVCESKGRSINRGPFAP